jgi:ribosomal protein S26
VFDTQARYYRLHIEQGRYFCIHLQICTTRIPIEKKKRSMNLQKILQRALIRNLEVISPYFLPRGYPWWLLTFVESYIVTVLL